MACELEWTYAENDAEIPLRIRPLREHWEARGPGMLAYLTRRLSWLELPKRLVVELTKPGMGGGETEVSAGQIRVEAFLANPLSQLPETARLAWLCSRSAVSESHRDTWVAAALIPATVEAAEYVELTTLDSPTVAVALQNWFRDSPNLTGDQLIDWWRELEANTFQTKRAWLHAVRKLDPLT